MIRLNILGMALFVWVVTLHPRTEGQVIPVVPAAPFSPKPLCNYQMALANQACAYLPYTTIPPPAPRAPYDASAGDEDTTNPVHRHRHRHEHDEDPDPDPHEEDEGDGDGDHDHDRDSEVDSEGDHDREGDHRHGDVRHGHGHRHRHHHNRHTPVEDQCCKWLAQVDDQCVCELLVKLPAFLARPIHKYNVVIGGACSFTFSCGSGLWK